MQRTVRELAPRLRAAQGRRRRRRLRAGVPRVAAGRQLHLLRAPCSTASAPTACPTASTRAPPASSPTRTCCRSCSRASSRRSSRTSCRATPTTADRRHRLLQQRLGHPPPRADRRHRGPRVGRGRQAAGGDASSSGASPRSAFTQKAAEIPLLQARSTTGSSRTAAPCRSRTPTARSARSSTASRSASCSTPTPASLKDDHRPHRLHDRRRRDRRVPRAAAPATWPCIWPSRGCATPYERRGQICARASSDEFGPISFSRVRRLRRRRPAPLLLRLGAARASGGRGPRARRGDAAGHHLGGPRACGARRRRFGEREGRRLFRPLHHAREPQRPLPRGDAARGGARGRAAPREPRGAARGRDRAAHRGDARP